MKPKRISLTQLILFIILVFSGLVYFYFHELNVSKLSDKIIINGLIEEMDYSEKGYMELLINGEWYYFSTSNQNDQFRVGDSIVKKKNESKIELYRNGSHFDSYFESIGK